MAAQCFDYFNGRTPAAVEKAASITGE